MTRITFLFAFLFVGCASTIEPCPPTEINGTYDVVCNVVGVYDNGNMEMYDSEHTLEVSMGHLLFPRPSCRVPLIVVGNDIVSGSVEPCVRDPYRTDTFRSVTGTISCDGDLIITMELDTHEVNEPDDWTVERTYVCRGARR